MNRVAYKYRIYPNESQKEYFAKCFGCVRFFYNKSLDDMIELYRREKKFKSITPATYKDEFPFLKEVDSMALCNAQQFRNTAFMNFFHHHMGFPKYKTKKNSQSYTTSNNIPKRTIRFSDNDRYITIPKCKRIRIRKHRNFEGTIKSATISKTTDEKYYISILVERDITPIENTNKAIGLDLGVKDLIVDSNGTIYKNQKYLSKSQSKLSREQRKMDRMKRDSKNYNKQKIKVARLYKHVTNQRKDYLHKVSKRIVDENQVICVEDLIVKTMVKERNYNKELLDASVSRLLEMITYKATWYGRTLVKVPYDYPSSQLCSSCGYKNSSIKDLRIRKWTCPNCSSNHDRDINAAKNILSKGIEMLTKDGVHPDSLFTLEPPGTSSKKLTTKKLDMPLAEHLP